MGYQGITPDGCVIVVSYRGERHKNGLRGTMLMHYTVTSSSNLNKGGYS